MALDPSNGFVAAGNVADLADGTLPIFDVERVQLQFNIAADFVAAQAANNVLILALSNGRILRIDLNRPEDIDGRPEPAPWSAGSAGSAIVADVQIYRHRSSQEGVRGGRDTTHVP
jgi:hypothetical protein